MAWRAIFSENSATTAMSSAADTWSARAVGRATSVVRPHWCCRMVRSSSGWILTMSNAPAGRGGSRVYDDHAPTYHQHRFPAEIITHAVWLYHVKHGFEPMTTSVVLGGCRGDIDGDLHAHGRNSVFLPSPITTTGLRAASSLSASPAVECGEMSGMDRSAGDRVAALLIECAIASTRRCSSPAASTAASSAVRRPSLCNAGLAVCCSHSEMAGRPGPVQAPGDGHPPATRRTRHPCCVGHT